MNKIEKLQKEYIDLLDIDPYFAIKNSKYIYDYIKIILRDGRILEKDSIHPIAIMIEYVVNEKDYKKNINNLDRVEIEYNGSILPFLANIPYKYYDYKYIMIEPTEFKDKDNKTLIKMTEILTLQDKFLNKVL